jgi:integrase
MCLRRLSRLGQTTPTQNGLYSLVAHSKRVQKQRVRVTAWVESAVTRPGKTGADGRELQSARKWFAKCLAEAEIKNFHWHDLRHTFATRLGAANVQFHHIEYLLGHDKDNITLRYAHPDMPLLRTAVGFLDREPKTGTKTGTSPVLQFQSA